MLERLFKGASGDLVEFAAEVGDDWKRRYYPPGEAPQVADKLKGRVDVYFGPALRCRPSPTKDAVGKARVGWVDYDGPSYAAYIPPSYVVKTQHGYHLYYLLDNWYGPDVIREVNKALIDMVGGDADKGCWNVNRVLRVPGTAHREGVVVRLIRKGGYVYTPGELRGLLGLESKYRHKVLTGDSRGYSSRSERDFAVIGALLRHGATPSTVLAVYREHRVGDKYREEAKRGNGRHYLETTLSNVRTVGAGEKAGTKSERVLALVLTSGITLLVDQRGIAYALIEREGHRELLPVDSTRFSDYLAYLLYGKSGETISRQTLRKVVQVLRSQATFEGESARLSNRVTKHGEAIWYDLSDNDWRALRVTKEEWTLVDKPPTLFRRFIHQRPQEPPVHVEWAKTANLLWRIFEFVNIRDEDSRLLFMVYLISTFVPDIAHPIITLHGEQGTGKSFAQRVVRQLIDPSAVSTLSVPWRAGEFVQQLDHHWCAYYDNITSLTDWQQDTLCRAVTGEGHTKRKLYSDDEDIIYAYRRCVGLNGISITSSRPDVLDRSLMFELQQLEGFREQEKVLLGKFRALKPALLGACLNVLSRALAVPEDPRIQEAMDFRLADWAMWGYRIARALGEDERFLSLYGAAIKQKSRAALRLHPLGQAALELMSARKEWVGTASDLLDELEAAAIDLGIDRTRKEWPGGANWLGRRLREVIPDLRKMNIVVQAREEAAGTIYKLENRGEVREKSTTEIAVGDMVITI